MSVPLSENSELLWDAIQLTIKDKGNPVLQGKRLIPYNWISHNLYSLRRKTLKYKNLDGYTNDYLEELEKAGLVKRVNVNAQRNYYNFDFIALRLNEENSETFSARVETLIKAENLRQARKERLDYSLGARNEVAKLEDECATIQKSFYEKERALNVSNKKLNALLFTKAKNHPLYDSFEKAMDRLGKAEQSIASLRIYLRDLNARPKIYWESNELDLKSTIEQGFTEKLTKEQELQRKLELEVFQIQGVIANDTSHRDLLFPAFSEQRKQLSELETSRALLSTKKKEFLELKRSFRSSLRKIVGNEKTMGF